MQQEWDVYFMNIVNAVKEKSSCLRRHVGAVIVRDNTILSTGFNDVPNGTRDCSITGCYRDKHNIPSGQRVELCRAIHAEQNAIAQAAYNGVSIKGATIYVNVRPCVICTKMIINAGIERIVYIEDYPDELSLELLKETNIRLTKMKI